MNCELFRNDRIHKKQIGKYLSISCLTYDFRLTTENCTECCTIDFLLSTIFRSLFTDLYTTKVGAERIAVVRILKSEPIDEKVHTTGQNESPLRK